MTTGVDGAVARVGRDGTLSLAFERRGARTIVARSHFTLPLQVLGTMALGDPAAIVSILNPTGGLVGGDRLDIDVTVGESAHACLTTPSATKVYRATGAPAEQHVRLRVADGALVEWVPDHTIPFAGAAFRQTIAVDVAGEGTVIVVDAYAAGRVARGESWRFARLDSRLSIRDVHGPILEDRFVLSGARTWDGLGLSESRPYFATVAAVGGRHVDALRDALESAVREAPDVAAGVARLARRGLLLRCLAPDAPALLETIDRAWQRVREALGLPALALRKP